MKSTKAGGAVAVWAAYRMRTSRRVGLVGGDLCIEPGAAGGTRLEIRLPVGAPVIS